MQCSSSRLHVFQLRISVLLPSSTHVPQALEQKRPRPNFPAISRNTITHQITRHDTKKSKRRYVGSSQTEPDIQKARYRTRGGILGISRVAYRSELISLSASSSTNAVGLHLGLIRSSFSFRACIQGTRSLCFDLAVITNATGTPFLQSSNTIIENRGYCK